MLSFFRTNQSSINLLLIAYALVLQLPVWFLDVPVSSVDPTEGFLAHIMHQWAHPTYVAPALAAGWIALVGLVANIIASRYNYSRTITQFPGVFVVLVWSIIPAARDLHGIQPALFFVALSITSLGRIYRSVEPAVALFNAGAWLAVASLFYQPVIYFIPVLFIAISILRRPEVIRFLQTLVGYGVVMFLAGSWMYFQGQWSEFVTVQFSGLGWIELVKLEGYNLWGLIILMTLVLIDLLMYGRIVQMLNIEGRKGVNILYSLMLIAGVSLLFTNYVAVEHAQLIALPAGALLGLTVGRLSSGQAEFVHLILWVAAMLLVIFQWM